MASYSRRVTHEYSIVSHSFLGQGTKISLILHTMGDDAFIAIPILKFTVIRLMHKSLRLQPGE